VRSFLASPKGLISATRAAHLADNRPPASESALDHLASVIKTGKSPECGAIHSFNLTPALGPATKCSILNAKPTTRRYGLAQLFLQDLLWLFSLDTAVCVRGGEEECFRVYLSGRPTVHLRRKPREQPRSTDRFSRHGQRNPVVHSAPVIGQ
jgi:hypothetical protein